jgi:hypothetical protein
MDAEVAAGIGAEEALHHGAKDDRVDRLPVEPGDLPERLRLVLAELHQRRSCEKIAVDAGQPPQGISPDMLVRVVQNREQTAEHEIGLPVLLGLHEVEDLFGAVPFDHPVVLGEEQPHQLQHEVADHRRLGGSTIQKPLVDPGEGGGSLGRERPARVVEQWLLGWPGEEEQCLVPVRKVVQGERHPRLDRTLPRLPDLEPLEGAQHNVRRGRAFRGHIGGVPPVPQRLLAVAVKHVRRPRSLHLDDDHAWQQQVHDPGGGVRLLEHCAGVLAVAAVAGEQLVEEGLRLAPLGASVVTPAPGERHQRLPDLLPAAHAQKSRCWPALK